MPQLRACGNRDFTGDGMREELRLELQRKITAKFEEARGPLPPTPPKISEAERVARVEARARLLFEAALRKL
jgi:hypothetical protein